MAMSVGGSGGPKADINMTPMIDVLLVLIIIFMVITPLTPKGLEALVPQPPPPNQKQPPPDNRTIVVQVLQQPNGARSKLKINQDDVSWNDLGTRLTDIFKTRAERIMFVKGDDDVQFQEIAQVIDTAKGTQVIDKIGLLTRNIE